MTATPIRWRLRPGNTWVDVSDIIADAHITVGTDIGASALSIPTAVARGRLTLRTRAGTLPVPDVGTGWAVQVQIGGTEWWTGLASTGGKTTRRNVDTLTVALQSLNLDAMAAPFQQPDLEAQSIGALADELAANITVAGGSDAPPVRTMDAGNLSGTRITILERLARWSGGICLERRNGTWLLCGIEQGSPTVTVPNVAALEGDTRLPMLRSVRGSADVSGLAVDVTVTASSWRAPINARQTTGQNRFNGSDRTRRLIEIRNLRITSVVNAHNTSQTFPVGDYTARIEIEYDARAKADDFILYVTGPPGVQVTRQVITSFDAVRVPVGASVHPATLVGPGSPAPLMVLPDWETGGHETGAGRMIDLYARSQPLRLHEIRLPLLDLDSSTLAGLLRLDAGIVATLGLATGNVTGRVLALRLSQAGSNTVGILTADMLTAPAGPMPSVVPRILQQGDDVVLWTASRPNVSTVETRWRINTGSWSAGDPGDITFGQSKQTLNLSSASTGDTVTAQARTPGAQWTTAQQDIYDVP